MAQDQSDMTRHSSPDGYQSAEESIRTGGNPLSPSRIGETLGSESNPGGVENREVETQETEVGPILRGGPPEDSPLSEEDNSRPDAITGPLANSQERHTIVAYYAAAELWVQVRRSRELRRQLHPESREYADEILYEQELWEVRRLGYNKDEITADFPN